MALTLEQIQWFVTERPYAEMFSYEERCELFNQFQIPVNQAVFCPLYSWLDYSCGIAETVFDVTKLRAESYSHSGAVLSELGKAVFTEKDIWATKESKYGAKIAINTRSLSFRYASGGTAAAYYPHTGFYINNGKQVYVERSFKFLQYFKLV